MYINSGKNQVVPTKENHQNIRIVSWGENQAALLRKGV